jgi:hypothetical protein
MFSEGAQPLRAALGILDPEGCPMFQTFFRTKHQPYQKSKGLLGPIDGKTYQAGYMAPAKTFGIEREDRLADLLTYIRYAWGNEGGRVDKSTVSSIKKKYEKRSEPWTDEGLKKLR